MQSRRHFRHLYFTKISNFLESFRIPRRHNRNPRLAMMADINNRILKARSRENLCHILPEGCSRVFLNANAFLYHTHAQHRKNL